MSNDNKSKPASASKPTKPLSPEDMKSATGGADCFKGPDGVTFKKQDNKGQATHGTKRPTRP